jgi:hypothetical protein
MRRILQILFLPAEGHVEVILLRNGSCYDFEGTESIRYWEDRLIRSDV